MTIISLNLRYGEYVSYSESNQEVAGKHYENDSYAGRLLELAHFCGFDSADALLDSLESLIARCGLALDGSVIKPEDFKDLSVAISKDSINYSAPMTFTHAKIIGILSEINKIK